ncbi:MAG: hypothetical protein ABWX96_18795 [Propionibacteriaceae bacterium]
MSDQDPEVVEPVDTEALDRSREAIDEGHEAAQRALDDDDVVDLDTPATGENDQAAGQESTPRPN